MDYTIFYKSNPVSEDEISSLGSWDLLISAFNQTDRVNKVFDKVQAKEKIWIVHSEYAFNEDEMPQNAKIFNKKTCSESEFVIELFNSLNLTVEQLKRIKICVDSTGFIRPHLMFLVLYLFRSGIEEFDVLYSEPVHYTKKEKTEFSKGAVEDVRFVDGFGGTLNRDTSGDLLVIGAGFDHNLLLEVTASKEHARRIQIVGFPSLQADMYQQCRLRTYQEADTTAEDNDPFFAPANDPFVTATVISELVEKYDQEAEITNLYLSPLCTKAQTLGFVLYFIGECMDGERDGGVIFPVSEYYSKETSKGISKVWNYHIEFPFA